MSDKKDAPDVFLGRQLRLLAAELAEWSQKTFGPDSEKGPIGALKHLELEAVEAINSLGDPEEYADCFLLILDAWRRSKHGGVLDLVSAGIKKMWKNKKREWPPPRKDEPVEHLKEQAPPTEGQGDMWLAVIQDMQERRLHGIEKYGRPLQANNGRKALVDAYQEALDLCVYLRQELEERKLLT